MAEPEMIEVLVTLTRTVTTPLRVRIPANADPSSVYNYADRLAEAAHARGVPPARSNSFCTFTGPVPGAPPADDPIPPLLDVDLGDMPPRAATAAPIARDVDDDPAVDETGLLDTLCDRLLEAGIACISVPYSGSGDSGSVDAEDSAATDANGATVEVAEELRDDIADYIEEILPGGWELNEGSDGTVTITPAGSPRVEVAHGIRVETTEYENFTVA